MADYPKSGDETTGTRVDLGEDLVREPTGLTPMPLVAAPKTPEDSNAEKLKSAKILFSEGLSEEAKKHLHQIIIADPHYLPARKLLDEIHDAELKQIFSDDELPRRRRLAGPTGKELEIDLRRIDTEDIMARLDGDLELGLNAPQLSLLSDPEAMAEFQQQLEQNLSSATVQDRIDLGIAFLEVGLFDVSTRIFRSATRFPEDPLLLSASSLLAYSMILGGHPFDATLVIQPILQDTEVPGASKVEFIYLMGRAQEALNKLDQAIQWYRQLRELEPRYRDVDERLARLSMSLG